MYCRLVSALATLAILAGTSTTAAAQQPNRVTVEAGMPITQPRVGERYVSYLGRSSRSSTVLHNTSLVELWKLQGQAGQCLQVVMRSTELDSLVGLYSGELRYAEISKVMEDDDSAGGRDARIRFMLPSSGTYYVAATSASGQAQGRYSLDIGLCPYWVRTAPAGSDNGPSPFAPASAPDARR
jgi:hypothetical protein